MNVKNSLLFSTMNTLRQYSYATLAVFPNLLLYRTATVFIDYSNFIFINFYTLQNR